jgi:hypothetical protein
MQVRRGGSEKKGSASSPAGSTTSDNHKLALSVLVKGVNLLKRNLELNDPNSALTVLSGLQGAALVCKRMGKVRLQV